MATKLIVMAMLGASGTLARYGLQGLVYRIYPGGFPLGTLIVNLLGCFLFGLIWPLAEERLIISGEMRTIILIGFMGSFTTFSSFIFETGELLRESEWLLAMANLLIQNVVGLGALYAGMALGKSL